MFWLFSDILYESQSPDQYRDIQCESQSPDQYRDIQCESQSPDQYRDSLEETDFVHKVSKFESLTQCNGEGGKRQKKLSPSALATPQKTAIPNHNPNPNPQRAATAAGVRAGSTCQDAKPSTLTPAEGAQAVRRHLELAACTVYRNNSPQGSLSRSSNLKPSPPPKSFSQKLIASGAAASTGEQLGREGEVAGKTTDSEEKQGVFKSTRLVLDANALYEVSVREAERLAKDAKALCNAPYTDRTGFYDNWTVNGGKKAPAGTCDNIDGNTRTLDLETAIPATATSETVDQHVYDYPPVEPPNHIYDCPPVEPSNHIYDCPPVEPSNHIYDCPPVEPSNHDYDYPPCFTKDGKLLSSEEAKALQLKKLEEKSGRTLTSLPPVVPNKPGAASTKLPLSSKTPGAQPTSTSSSALVSKAGPKRAKRTVCKRDHSPAASDSEDENNPWRVNLKSKLRPNLDNFKGEKCFSKNTAVTKVVLSGFESGSEEKEVQAEDHKLPARVGKAACVVTGGSADSHSTTYSATGMNKDTAKMAAAPDSGQPYTSSSSSPPDGWHSPTALSSATPDSGCSDVVLSTASPNSGCSLITLSNAAPDSGVLHAASNSAAPDNDPSQTAMSSTAPNNGLSYAALSSAAPDSGLSHAALSSAAPDSEVLHTALSNTAPDKGLSHTALSSAAPNSGVSHTSLSSTTPDIGVSHTALTSTTPDMGVSHTTLSSAAPDMGVLHTALSSTTPDIGVSRTALSSGTSQASRSCAVVPTTQQLLVDEKEVRNSALPCDLDLGDLTSSQQELRELHERMRQERKQEQEAAAREKQRLEDILAMCAEYEKQLDSEKQDPKQPESPSDRRELRNSKIKTNGSLTKLASPSQCHKEMTAFEFKCHRGSTSSGSTSEDEGSENGTIKRRPMAGLSTLPAAELTEPSVQAVPPQLKAEPADLLMCPRSASEYGVCDLGGAARSPGSECRSTVSSDSGHGSHVVCTAKHQPQDKVS